MREGRSCYLCGKPATTQDHVPPKTLFPKPRPQTLITLPCCSRCNGAYSLDEEYFRNNISMLSNPAHAWPIWKAAHRSLKRRPKLYTDTMRRISPLQIGDLVVPLMRYEAKRTNRVLSKISLGLLFHHTHQRLANSVRHEAFPLEGDIPDSLRSVIRKLPFRGRWEGTFAYIGGMCTDDPNTGLWLMAFYVSRAFLVHFHSVEEKPTDFSGGSERAEMA